MGKLHAVTGEIDPTSVSVIDVHTHVWIDPVHALDPQPMILNDKDGIERELSDFHAVGGSLIVDCQPAHECGRHGAMLRQISQATGVWIIASTGFHLRRYYPPNAPIYDWDEEMAYQSFMSEFNHGLTEAPDVCAGVIKIACEETLQQSPKHLICAAVKAGINIGAALEVHTERGSDAEAIARFILDQGLAPNKLILCHLDKRADLGLHRELAGSGIMLEYDTFLRPKYEPEQHVWQLLPQMVEAGWAERILLATDLADAHMWQHLGSNGAGAAAFITVVQARLVRLGFPLEAVRALMGGNAARCLAY